MKYFAVSDVHDHCSLLKAALNEAGFDPDRTDHTLVLLGDAFTSGPEPGETFRYLKDLHEKGRLILICGNHEFELLDNLKSGSFRRPGNRRCAAGVVRLLTGRDDLSDPELAARCGEIGFTAFLERMPVPYFETAHYVFTHGFIPTDRRAYRADWRNATVKEWRSAAVADGMLLAMHQGISEPGKTILFGHYSAARCHLMRNASPEDWANRIYKDVSRVPKEGFRPFFGKTFVALDAGTRKTGFVNCVVLEDEECGNPTRISRPGVSEEQWTKDLDEDKIQAARESDRYWTGRERVLLDLIVKERPVSDAPFRVTLYDLKFFEDRKKEYEWIKKYYPNKVCYFDY